MGKAFWGIKKTSFGFFKKILNPNFNNIFGIFPCLSHYVMHPIPSYRAIVNQYVKIWRRGGRGHKMKRSILFDIIFKYFFGSVGFDSRCFFNAGDLTFLEKKEWNWTQLKRAKNAMAALIIKPKHFKVKV